MSVQKFRISKNEGNYTTFPNKVLQNLKNLEALGLYCYLLSLPHGWEFHKNHLRKHCGVGINKLNNLLCILEKHALVKTVQIRTEKGRFAHFNLEVNDGTSFIINELEESVQPYAENRDTDNRATDNSTYKRKTIQKKESTKEISLNNSATDVAHARHDGLFDEFWKIHPVKKNKVRARKIWERKKLDRIAELICQDIENRLKHDSHWQDKHFIPHPSSYLINELWNDEITSQPQNSKKEDAYTKGMKAFSAGIGGNTYDQSGNVYDPFH